MRRSIRIPIEESGRAGGSVKQGEVKGACKKAVALQYGDLDRLPAVVAGGCGEMAKRIIALAQEHGIPVTSNAPLAAMLSALKCGDEIPAESFALVAEVISFLYHVDKEWREEHGFLSEVMSLNNPAEDGEAAGG